MVLCMGPWPAPALTARAPALALCCRRSVMVNTSAANALQLWTSARPVGNQPKKRRPPCRHPFIIDPATNPAGEEYLAYNVRRWGGDGWTHELRASGARDGASFGNWVTWPSTLLAHQLVRHAAVQGGVGKAAEVKHRLFLLT